MLKRSLKPNVNGIDLTLRLQNRARPNTNYNIVFEFLKGNSLVGSFSKNISDRKKPLEEHINITHINDFNNIKITIKGNSNGWRGIVKYDWTLKVLSTKKNTKVQRLKYVVKNVPGETAGPIKYSFDGHLGVEGAITKGIERGLIPGSRDFRYIQMYKNGKTYLYGSGNQSGRGLNDIYRLDPL